MSPAARSRRAAGARGARTGVPPLLRELLARARAVGLRARPPAAVWREAAGAFAEVEHRRRRHAARAVVAPAHGCARGRARLLVMGHIDEIGLIVTHIDDDGYLWFARVGGWDPQILVGQRVVLDTRDGPVTGVVGKKPIHLLRDEERKKVAEIRDLHIDIGARDGEQARELRAHRRRRRDRRRAGRAAQRAARLARAGQPPRLLRRARGRAAGGRGRAARSGSSRPWPRRRRRSPSAARARARSRSRPTRRSCVDVTHATDAPGIEVKEAGKHELGSGPVISRGSTLNPALFELLLRRPPRREKIPFTRRGHRRARPAPTPTPSTSAAAACRRRSSSIPLRYMHSPVELVQLDDVARLRAPDRRLRACA